MINHDDAQQFLPDDAIDPDRIVVDVPVDPQSPYQEKIPSGYDPMGSIYLRGRAYRGLAGGRIPWWVLISGWIIFGGLALLMLIFSISSGVFGLLTTLVILVIPLIILWRGTSAKMSIQKRRNKRR